MAETLGGPRREYRKPKLTQYGDLAKLKRRDVSENPGGGAALSSFCDAIADGARLDTYAAALRKVIASETIAVVVGSGAGILSLLACRFGARRVYAFVPSEGAEMLRALARENRFQDRLIVIEEANARAKLPEQAHLLISAPESAVPSFMKHVRDLVVARRLHLAAGGRIVPKEFVLFAALVHAPAAFERRRLAWKSESYGLEIASTRRFFDNARQKYQVSADDLRSKPTAWATVDCSREEDRISGRATWTVEHACKSHGVTVWFDAELVDGVRISTRPSSEPTAGGQIFFPWPRPVDLGSGDIVTTELRADPVGDTHVWTWNTEITAASSAPLLKFRQSDFAADPWTATALHRRAADLTTSGLSPTGHAVILALAKMEAGLCFSDVAEALCSQFPGDFRTASEALAFTADLADAYSL